MNNDEKRLMQLFSLAHHEAKKQAGTKYDALSQSDRDRLAAHILKGWAGEIPGVDNLIKRLENGGAQ